MKLRLVRIYANDDETLGILSINNKEECFVLEDQYQLDKIYGETRIPTGTYKIKLRTTGRMHSKYSIRFPSFHKGMLEIQDVPNFKYIYIHIGNDDNDTLGCLLLGVKSVINNGKIKIENSTDAYVRFYQKVIKHIDNLTIQIV